MPDIGGPDLDLLLAELDVKRTQLQLNVKSGIVNERRHLSEINKILENRKASELALADIESQIQEVEARLQEQ